MTDDKVASRSQELGVMEGKGFYNKHSRPQHSAVAFGLPLLERAVEAVPWPDPGDVFGVADYGVAGGRNSMEPGQTIIDVVGRRWQRKGRRLFRPFPSVPRSSGKLGSDIPEVPFF